jgi:ribosomal protein S18 acetylase RimI-like enzyme
MSEESVTVRLARADEYEIVGELTHAAYASDYVFGASYAEQLLHPEQRVGEYELWVAEDDRTGALLGTVSTLRPGQPDPHGDALDEELYFRLLAVAPTARRRGIGALLTRFTLELARERGRLSVVLNSASDMLGAHALYASLGFERQPHREYDFVSDGQRVTLLTFAKPVTP